MADTSVHVKSYYDIRKQYGYSHEHRDFSYLEYLEFSTHFEFKKFRMLGKITERELSRAKLNLDGLILALQG